jgi:predicted amidohydrolase
MDLMVVQSCSPGRDLSGNGFGSLRMLQVLNEACARSLGVFVVHANRVGTEEGVTFAGGSEIWEPTGRRAASGP